jgi:hypothetical protein
MGAEEFEHFAQGKTMRHAFNEAVEEAEYDHGHSGYTGTIAEKGDFTNFGSLPSGTTECELMDWIYDGCFPDGSLIAHHFKDKAEEISGTYTDKWGPAAGFEIKPGEYVFVGLASS